MQRRSTLDTNRWAWSATRKLVLARDNRRCQGRGPYCTVHAVEVDHITPRALGGGDEMDNLRSLCRPCHLSRGIWDSAKRSRYSYGRSQVVTRRYD